MAAALSAHLNGAKVLILERNESLGGILPQCIHNGFGSILFKKDLPGPTYAARYEQRVRESDITVMTDTMVMNLTPGRRVYATNSKLGYLDFQAGAVVLAMGCRERTRAQIRIPGARPAGVFTAGMVQRMVNIEGFMPGRRFVILGSGDIGMIMARRLTLEGAKVVKVLELMPYLTGLRRNYVQCLQDFNIPLALSTTVSRIVGRERVEAVETVRVEGFQPIKGTEERIECDSLLLSVGLIPENELSREAGVELDVLTGGPLVDEGMATTQSGIFAAGNVVTIHDLVDWVSMGGERAGQSAARFAKQSQATETLHQIKVQAGEGVRTVVPHYLNRVLSDSDFIVFQLRVTKPSDSAIVIEWVEDGRILHSAKQPYGRPAEMVTLKLPVSTWKEMETKVQDSLTVRVTEVV